MGRAPCCEKIGLNKGRWSSEEDDILSNYVSIHGEGSWRSLPKNAGLKRCGKSCRLRWINYLKADVKRGNISKEEEDKIIKLHSTLGNRWSLIASHLDGRTDNEIKNHWNTHLIKRLHKIGKIHDGGSAEVVTGDLGKVSSNNKPHKFEKIYRSLQKEVTNSNNKVCNSLNSSEHDVGNKSEQNKPNSEFSCVSDELWAMNDDIVSGPERPISYVDLEENMPNIDLSWPNIECPNVEYSCPNKEDIVAGAFNSGRLFDELNSWSNYDYDMDNLFDNNVIHEEENIEDHENRENCWAHVDEAQIWDWGNLDLGDGVGGDTCVGFDDLW